MLMIGTAKCHSPVGVELVSVHLPRVARSSQPWALLRNPFGIGFGNEALLDSKIRVSRVSNQCKVHGQESSPTFNHTRARLKVGEPGNAGRGTRPTGTPM